ncbi:tetratricopeptide repeat protein 5 [Stylonychia lemnae]|uniref:Tetratricopeptide repeat protein 5 n=1 Tax=Stylonychia lemnae TaxID=5949 RepID=A0A078A230_STYLE|nr:tetratricopeptide repeat protein 5 [Stylonychia lemnae]|eukprot:CDW76195.1 tetratricopeptide repeat protein 5 [Stylonychia lemnae]
MDTTQTFAQDSSAEQNIGAEEEIKQQGIYSASLQNIEMSDQVKLLVEQLDHLDKSYFGKDRHKLIKQKIDDITQLLDTKPIEFIQNKKEKADLLYLRGKALDYLPEYSKNAEDFLSKSIKLMPTKQEAWDALGHVYWKKRDLASARKCFEDAEQKKLNYKESIVLANKAVSLDLSDPQSWYVLGNAHLTNFFVNQGSTDELTQALKTYTQTERLQKEPNPDLYYNRATIYEYLERYNEAVRDYLRAHSIDPNLQADQRAEKIVNFVIQAYTLIQQKGRVKSNKLINMVKSVPTTLPHQVSFPTNEEQKQKIIYNVVATSQIEAGENSHVIVSAKVVCHLAKEQDVPMCFLVVDFKYNFSVVSIYHTNKSLTDIIKPGDEILIKNPQMIHTSLEFKGKLYNYQTLKVTDITNILINSAPLIAKYSEVQVITNTFV